MDIEVPAKSPRPFSHITRHGRHLLRLETILVLIYYPSTFTPSSVRRMADKRSRSSMTWLPGPRAQTAKGYGKFAGLPQWVAVLFFLITTWFTKIPASPNANIAAHWPPQSHSRQGGYETKDKKADSPDERPGKPAFPLMVFSHGMGGSRTAYSSLCGEFASYGFIVCAVEHRDGSGARTIVNSPSTDLDGVDEREQSGKPSHHGKNGRPRDYDVIDFIWPQGNPWDTRPGNSKGVDEELRAHQLEFRLAEIEEVFELVQAINDGKGEYLARTNLRSAGAMGASSLGLDGIDWHAWKDRIDIDQVTMLGHSFGAATAIEILRNTDRFRWVKQGIIYDIWGAPVKSASDPQHRICLPLLGINSEAFMYWEENLDTVKSLCREAEEQGALSWLMTIRGTVHLSQSDFCVLYPRLAAVWLKQTMKPQRALDLNVSASLEFLSRVMPRPLAPFHRSLNNQEMLKQPCISDLPTEHKPVEKYMAARLKLEHELRGRFVPKIRRQLKKVGGLGGDNHEAWMHIAPTPDTLQNWDRARGVRSIK